MHTHTHTLVSSMSWFWLLLLLFVIMIRAIGLKVFKYYPPSPAGDEDRRLATPKIWIDRSSRGHLNFKDDIAAELQQKRSVWPTCTEWSNGHFAAVNFAGPLAKQQKLHYIIHPFNRIFKRLKDTAFQWTCRPLLGVTSSSDRKASPKTRA